MSITALVMAGGRGKRLSLPAEKPLVNIHGKPMIQYVIDALKKSKNVDRIIVVTTKNTRKTFDEVKKLQVEVEEAPGEDYIPDIHYVARKLKLNCTLLIVSADLPCIISNIIGEIIEHFRISGKPALCTAVSSETYKKLGLKINYTIALGGKKVVPVGINLIRSDRIDDPEIEEELFTLTPYKAKFVVNVNTVEDLMIAAKVLT